MIFIKKNQVKLLENAKYFERNVSVGQGKVRYFFFHIFGGNPVLGFIISDQVVHIKFVGTCKQK